MIYAQRPEPSNPRAEKKKQKTKGLPSLMQFLSRSPIVDGEPCEAEPTLQRPLGTEFPCKWKQGGWPARTIRKRRPFHTSRDGSGHACASICWIYWGGRGASGWGLCKFGWTRRAALRSPSSYAPRSIRCEQLEVIVAINDRVVQFPGRDLLSCHGWTKVCFQRPWIRIPRWQRWLGICCSWLYLFVWCKQVQHEGGRLDRPTQGMYRQSERQDGPNGLCLTIRSRA